MADRVELPSGYIPRKPTWAEQVFSPFVQNMIYLADANMKQKQTLEKVSAETDAQMKINEANNLARMAEIQTQMDSAQSIEAGRQWSDIYQEKIKTEDPQWKSEFQAKNKRLPSADEEALGLPSLIWLRQMPEGSNLPMGAFAKENERKILGKIELQKDALQRAKNGDFSKLREAFSTETDEDIAARLEGVDRRIAAKWMQQVKEEKAGKTAGASGAYSAGQKTREVVGSTAGQLPQVIANLGAGAVNFGAGALGINKQITPPNVSWADISPIAKVAQLAGNASVPKPDTNNVSPAVLRYIAQQQSSGGGF